MKRILFSADFYNTNPAGQSYVQFAKGEHYEPDDEARRCVARGIAEEVDVEEPKASEASDDAAAGGTADAGAGSDAAEVEKAPAAASEPAKAKKK
jgi:hypothetical protein